VKYYNSFMEEECLHIIMEYAEKGDLHGYLRRVKDQGQTLPEDLIWLIAFQICLGVGYLHSQKTVHRDLKCMNILLTKDDVVKIGDFGVAKIINLTNTN
jgi:NIMA (never in mitosis gene a)-related kinase 1/4/5